LGKRFKNDWSNDKIVGLVVCAPNFRFLIFELNSTAEWRSNINTRVVVPSNGVGFDYSTSATIVHWNITCNVSCNIFLVDIYNVNRLKEGLGFESFYEKFGVTQDNSTFNSVKDIKNTVIIYVKNPSNNQSISVYFYQAQYFEDVPQKTPFPIYIVTFPGLSVFIIVFTSFSLFYLYRLWKRRREIKLSKDRADKGPTIIMDHTAAAAPKVTTVTQSSGGYGGSHVTTYYTPDYTPEYYAPDYSTTVDFGYTGGDVGFSGGDFGGGGNEY
jgi:hypothetical protein